jgi:GNAT superfamily N-acetyltransferase
VKTAAYIRRRYDVNEMHIPLTPYLIVFIMGIPRNQSSQTAPENPLTLPKHDNLMAYGVAEDEFHVRKFESARDQNQLETICRHVFQGNDYLPRTAKFLEQDEMSQFYVLTRQTRVDERSDYADEELQDEVLLACANLRTLTDQDVWMEAVRTAPEHRNQGHAHKLLETMLYRFHPQQIVYTCTVASNAPMIRVFEKLQMKYVLNIHLLEWSVLLRIPGWKSTDAANNRLNLLQGLGLSPWQYQDDGHEKSSYWQIVPTKTEVEKALESIRSQGGSGWVPALFEILSVRGSALQEALQNGMVWRRRRLTPEQTLPKQLDNGDDGDCLIALVRDPRIQSMKSSWVLCVSGTKGEHVRSAVEYACHPEMQRQLLRLQQENQGKNHADALEEGIAVGFVLAVDGTISKEGEFMRLLPWGKDPCVVYTKKAS